MPSSGGEGDEMEEVPDARMQAPPVQERTRKRKREELDIQNVLPCPESKALQLLVLPDALLREILPEGNLQSAYEDVRAQYAAYMDLIAAEKRLGEALQFSARWVDETKETFYGQQRRDTRVARLEAKKSLPAGYKHDDAQYKTAMNAANEQVRKKVCLLDWRYRANIFLKLQEFVRFFVQKMTRNAGPGDYFALIRRLSKPPVDRLVSQLDNGTQPGDETQPEDETQPKPCPLEFSPDGKWTIDSIVAFITQNKTVLLMKEVMCKSLDRDVCKCREKFNACTRQVGFATGGFRDFLLLQHALAQRREEEKNWRINGICLIR